MRETKLLSHRSPRRGGWNHIHPLGCENLSIHTNFQSKYVKVIDYVVGDARSASPFCRERRERSANLGLQSIRNRFRQVWLRLLLEAFEGSCGPLGRRNFPRAKKEARGQKSPVRFGAFCGSKLGSC